MKAKKDMLIAFILNSAFSIFEFLGGIYTGSVAISADAFHDLLDAMGLGLAFFLEKKSESGPNETDTYGGGRYSVLGGLCTSFVLIFGSLAMIAAAVKKLINPAEINYDGMLVFSIIGTAVNLLAAFFTRGGESLGRRAVNLHMLEDALGWVAVLAGALVMKLTRFSLIDPILSIGISLFILINALRLCRSALWVLLDRAPKNLSLCSVEEELKTIPEVLSFHHLHVWSIDSENVAATVHIVSSGDAQKHKHLVREVLEKHGISHATIETETRDEHCHFPFCEPKRGEGGHHHHHHH